MSSHKQDATKIELLMIENNMEKNHKNLPMIASQELDLPIKYVLQLINDGHVKTLEKAKQYQAEKLLYSLYK